MRVLSLDAVPRRAVDAQGSAGFTVGALGLTEQAHLVVVRLRAGGTIGRHPAAGRQLLVVVSGDATVSGADDERVEIGPGQAAVWEEGESHETSSTGGFTGFVVEGSIDIGGATSTYVDPP